MTKTVEPNAPVREAEKDAVEAAIETAKSARRETWDSISRKRANRVPRWTEGAPVAPKTRR